MVGGGAKSQMNFKGDTYTIWAMLMEYFPHHTDDALLMAALDGVKPQIFESIPIIEVCHVI